MAIWQNTFYVLPKESTLDLSPNLHFNEEGFDDSIFWKGEKLKPELFNHISTFLPIGKSWSKNLTIYGNVESNCFEVFQKEGSIVSVSFRIDFRSSYERILSELVEFLMMNGFLIVDENLEVLPLNSVVIIQKIKDSAQYKKYKKLM